MRVALAFLCLFLLVGAGDDLEPSGIRLSSCGATGQLPPSPTPTPEPEGRGPILSFGPGLLDFDFGDDDSPADDDSTLPDDDDSTSADDDDSTSADDDDDVTPPPVDADGDGWSIEDDCDDSDAAVHPGAVEACDSLDGDCDGDLVDDFEDLDGDGQPNCIDPDADGDGFAAAVNDCDDLDPAVYPTAPEVCDGVDSDCDGDLVAGFDDLDGDGLPDCADADVDGDGFEGPLGAGADCDDADADAWPGQPAWFPVERTGGGFDYDCDGVEELRYPSAFACASPCGTLADGWIDGQDPADAPSCGETGSFGRYCLNCTSGWEWGVMATTQGCR